MIFLSKKQLIPSLILLNVILLPCILPLLIFSFSFILDYACQLQAEADTTL